MSNCVWIDNDDCALSCATATTRRARKAHDCVECGKTIPAGALYEEYVGVLDGSWERYRTCARCVLVRDDYFRGGWVFGNVVADFEEAFGFDYRDGIPPDFAPCEDRRKPKAPPPESESPTVPMEDAP